MTTKIPSELSKRLQVAQRAWDDEVKAMKASVLNLEAFYNVQKRKAPSGRSKWAASGKSMARASRASTPTCLGCTTGLGTRLLPSEVAPQYEHDPS